MFFSWLLGLPIGTLDTTYSVSADNDQVLSHLWRKKTMLKSLKTFRDGLQIGLSYTIVHSAF